MIRLTPEGSFAQRRVRRPVRHVRYNEGHHIGRHGQGSLKGIPQEVGSLLAAVHHVTYGREPNTGYGDSSRMHGRDADSR